MVRMDSTRLDFGILLVLAYQEFVRELRATLTKQGFEDQGRSDGYVLRALGARPMTTSELAERLEISKQGAAQIIEDMERRG
jgi:DNA-binding MarR family transcriptional regulator